jgi:hypothetical protein
MSIDTIPIHHLVILFSQFLAVNVGRSRHLIADNQGSILDMGEEGADGCFRERECRAESNRSERAAQKIGAFGERRCEDGGEVGGHFVSLYGRAACITLLLDLPPQFLAKMLEK